MLKHPLPALQRLVLPSLWALSLSACSLLPTSAPNPNTSGVAASHGLPAALAGKARLLTPGDAAYAQAQAASAVMPAGAGGISQALVVELTEDLPVWRVWSGPPKTNRIGRWWSYDAPQGPVADYRRNYEICQAWNDLKWVARCSLRKGSVVAIGPGQSVSEATCGQAGEQYPANPRDWQTYVASPWQPSTTLDCPPESADYPADPNNLAKRLP